MNYLLLASYIFTYPWIACPLELPVTKQAQMVRLVNIPRAQVPSGGSNTVGISFQVLDGYHIQANEVEDDNLIPAKLSLAPPEGLVIDAITYPAFKLYKLTGDENLQVFDEAFKIDVRISASKNLEKKSFTMQGSLYYQACDAVRCFFPRTLNFEIQVLIQ